MTLEETSWGQSHYPKNPSKFVFDEEVAKAFDNMAVRSIPNYLPAHALHASLVTPALQGLEEHFVVYDVGASRGEFFKSICRHVRVDESVGHPLFNFVAIDTSDPMLNLLHRDMPWVKTLVADAADVPDFAQPADVVNMSYLLQFVETREARLRILSWAYANLKPGGYLLLGQKNKVSESFNDLFTDRYIQFRLDHGYTMAEVVAKTAALKNSMWPLGISEVEDMCYDVGFVDYMETSRWLQFSTSIAIKD